MKLSRLYSLLGQGELSNLILDPTERNTLSTDLANQVLSYLKGGLTDIYTRLPLLEKEVVFAAQTEVQIYYLQRIYAVQDITPMPIGMKYIKDTPDDPFIQDVLRISAVYDILGNQFPLNQPGDPESFYTPKYDALQHPRPVTGEEFVVHYHANHPDIDGTDLDVEVMVPPYLEMAIRAYVAGEVYASKNGPEHGARAVALKGTYLELMAQAENLDMALTSQAFENHKFDNRGFV